MVAKLLRAVAQAVVGLFRERPDPRDELVRMLMAQNADLMDRLQETIGQIHYHQVQQAVATSERLHVSEEEEDLRFQAAEGLIDEKALRDALAELDFQNSEITLG